MGHVFKSYSTRNKQQVDRIVQAIAASVISVWIDRSDKKARMIWQMEIVQALDTCDAFILTLFPNSITSDDVHREIDLVLAFKSLMFTSSDLRRLSNNCLAPWIKN